MGNTKFGTTNLLTQPGVVQKNGTGGGAPALIETAPYTMAQLLNSDRYSFWKSSLLTASTQYLVDFDLGATLAITAAAVQGFRLVSGGGPFVDVQYQTGAYAAAGTWTFLGSIVNLSTSNPRDDGVEFGSVSARSVRFVLTIGAVATQFSLGKFFIGQLTDTGRVHSPGGDYTPFQNRSETPQEGGSFVINQRGDDGMDVTLPFRALPSADRTTLEALEKVRGTFLLLDADGRYFEVFLRGGRVKVVRTYNNLFDVDVELQRAP